jgi:hypothetical protein
MLTTVGLAKLDAGDLGDRIGCVGRLQGPRQQCLLRNRLRSVTRIDARRAEKQKFFDTRAVSSMDDVRFNEQIVIEKVGRKSIVGVQPSHAAGCQEDDPRTPRRHPVFDLGLASQVHGRAAGIEQQRARFASSRRITAPPTMPC